MRLPDAFIEKDYFLWLLLKELTQHNENLVFKGGTALAKCHRIIKRFSEDIDLGRTDQTITQGQRKKLKSLITTSIDSLGLTLTNLDATRSRRDFNRYDIDVHPLFAAAGVNPRLFLETSVGDASIPYATQEVSSYIYDYLHSTADITFTVVQGARNESIAKAHFMDAIDLYDLAPFECKVMDLERTFIDKAFAICDYYLRNVTGRNSRHVYDLSKIMPHIALDDSLRELAREVREIRKGRYLCVSASDEHDIAKLIRAIHDERFYAADWRHTTAKMLYDDTTFNEANDALIPIADFFATVF
jgi:predicted nucleotidyltransferase component of viral defense system